MRVAARLERAVAHDQRRYARRPVQISAGLAAPDRASSAVTVVDLSTHGCGIELDSHVEAGARVWIALPGLESWAARVIWAQPGRAGLAFDRPLHQGVVDRYR
jgi:inactivated superfamily I helicase